MSIKYAANGMCTFPNKIRSYKKEHKLSQFISFTNATKNLSVFPQNAHMYSHTVHILRFMWCEKLQKTDLTLYILISWMSVISFIESAGMSTFLLCSFQCIRPLCDVWYFIFYKLTMICRYHFIHNALVFFSLSDECTSREQRSTILATSSR